MTKLNRRNFIVGLSAMMGGAAITPVGAKAFDAVISFKAGGKGGALSAAQLKMVERIADIIIPTTDTPGAAAAKVHEYIDHLVTNYLNEGERAFILKGLDALDKDAGGFNDLSQKKQIKYIAKRDKNMRKDDLYRSLKEVTIVGYYTSEIGASEELIFDPVPGPYRDATVAEIGRTYSI